MDKEKLVSHIRHLVDEDVAQEIGNICMKLMAGEKVKDKKVSFVEALTFRKLGFEIYGETPGRLIQSWNPQEQNSVSWYAIDNADWYVKLNTKGEKE